MASVLVYVGESPEGGFADGDIMRAHTRFDAMAARAEIILRGRGSITDESVLRPLQAVWDRLCGGERNRPPQGGIVDWWAAATETVTALEAVDPARYPFTHTEHKAFLPVHLDREITDDEVAKWPGKRRGGQVHWRSLVADNAVRVWVEGRTPFASRREVLDRRLHCFVDEEQRASIVLEG